ncbi:hypothetical protein DICPUDRAFT_159917 [Dictyostelium purpureum]|uniref:Uncharacterized protein n=1 Tax=Dictyostelium purpureum TaxID=5786 RepID=F1A5A1_DICPU|nr:uncharacterized protein DICPUDRAFT_159917 [Dictyostelium purpureum]EGC28630.1 hypothetical protein DICPUDRAFT_159917 [Dictyostelium purpureum]|eukprot:XP_003294844.1 hypothetical protein DICPUDRAFT_159917 [Dictyostelium purpureum]
MTLLNIITHLNNNNNNHNNYNYNNINNDNDIIINNYRNNEISIALSARVSFKPFLYSIFPLSYKN